MGGDALRCITQRLRLIPRGNARVWLRNNHMMSMKFGDYIKDRRIERGITLRNFCKDIQMDPSNWSKIERGVLAPPSDPVLVESLALALELNDEQKQEMADLADLARGQIPADLRDDETLAKMPAFFRTMRGQEFTFEDFEKLRQGVRKLHTAV